MRYSREDIYYWTTIAMLGVVIYTTYIVVAPTFDIVQNTNVLLKRMDDVLAQGIAQNNLTIQQNDEIIANQNNNTKQTQLLVQKLEENREEQVDYLFSILNQSNIIGNQTRDLILESIDKLDTLNNNTENVTGQISGFFGGPVITNQSIEELHADIISQAQNKTD